MKYDVGIIGAGIIGLAAAHKLKIAKPDLNIAIFEKETREACHQSGNNSGVIHSGVYYKPGSKKAENCRSGYAQLVEFCKSENIEHELCGKVIVATNDNEVPTLNGLKSRGQANGLTNLELLTPEEIKEKEPFVEGIKGLWVPQAGIVDYKKVAHVLRKNLERKGVEFFFKSKVISIKSHRDFVLIKTNEGYYQCLDYISCAGLYSDKVFAMENPFANDYRILPFRGEYYDLTPEASKKVRGLVYPVPDSRFPFLGVHLTKRIAGGVEAGPNAILAFAREGYTWGDIQMEELFEFLSWPGFRVLAKNYLAEGFQEMKRSLIKSEFLKSLQTLMPSLTEDDLVPGGAGVRAQLSDRAGGLVDDFVILRSSRGIHILNAPSPAATSCFAIGDEVVSGLV